MEGMVKENKQSEAEKSGKGKVTTEKINLYNQGLD